MMWFVCFCCHVIFPHVNMWGWTYRSYCNWASGLLFVGDLMNGNMHVGSPCTHEHEHILGVNPSIELIDSSMWLLCFSR